MVFRSPKHPSHYVKHSFFSGQGFAIRNSIITGVFHSLLFGNVVPLSGMTINNYEKLRYKPSLGTKVNKLS